MGLELIKSLLHALNQFPPQWAVAIISASPIGEIRLGLPVALFVYKMPIWKAFLFSVLGNISFIIPTLFLFEPVSKFLRRFGPIKKFFDWFFERTKKKAKLVQGLEFWGLAIFVGIPLPMTGAWSGCIAATLFKIKFRYALLANVLGVIMAGLIVLALCLSGKFIINL
ncbi:MAG: small multi-drug export protein [Candidatus Omnitrophota bacterium]|nr:small multi-drug export protein [Candidatus Omnitrophota bacterium]